MTHKYKTVIWDWNGTLLDDAQYCLEITNQLLLKRGLASIGLPRYLEVFGFPLQDYCRRLGFDLNAEDFEDLSAEFMELYEQRRLQCALRSGAVDVLMSFQKKGIKQAILSAYRQQTLDELVDHFALRTRFSYVVGVDNDLAQGKVATAVQWLEECGWDPQQAVMIGDTDHDLEVARALGTACILIAGGHQSRQRLQQWGGQVVANLTEFHDLISANAKCD